MSDNLSPLSNSTSGGSVRVFWAKCWKVFAMIKLTAIEVQLALDTINNQLLPSTLPKFQWQAQICLSNFLYLPWISLRQFLAVSLTIILLQRNPFPDQSLQVLVPQAVQHLTLQQWQWTLILARAPLRSMFMHRI